ncbi:MAG TPA: molybdopterin-dependent oxidoreductase [Firmicutes bacterium]|nr:molybdopterin-dependent oxidoreductase [Bacillota bacterium]
MSKRGKTARGTLAVVAAISLLTLTVALFAYLNAGEIAEKKELELSAEFWLVHDDKSRRVTMPELLQLGPVDFETIMKTSTTLPTSVTFSGVELNQLLVQYGMDISSDSVIQVTALDGYASAVTGEEVLTPSNVYLCIAMNGKPLKPKSQGGFGPYFLVIRNVEFAQRWCKYVERITIR